MKLFLSLVILCMFVFSCKNTDAKVAEGETTVADSTAAGSDPNVVNIDDSQLVDSKLKEVVSMEGKLPSEIDLLNAYELLPRLEKMMGAEFKNFSKDWEMQTPLKKDGDVMYTGGCKPGNCKSIKYFLIFDTKTDNVNFYYVKDGAATAFGEKSVITLTPKITDDFDNLRTGK